MTRHVLWGLCGLLLAGCATPSPAPVEPASPAEAAHTFTGMVVNVADGDTLTVLRQGSGQRVELSGIDCPELKQAYGKQAKRFVSDAALRQEVTVREEGETQAGWIVGLVALPDGRLLNQELVRAGLCWWQRKSTKDDTLPLLEAEAHAAQRGLWADPDPIPPWDWRKMKVKPMPQEKTE